MSKDAALERAIDAYLQPMRPEERISGTIAGALPVMPFDHVPDFLAFAVISDQLRFKVRCSFGSCRGHAGYLIDVHFRNVLALPPDTTADNVSLEVDRLPRVKEFWFLPLRGWFRSSDDIYRLSNRARKLANQGKPVTGRRQAGFWNRSPGEYPVDNFGSSRNPHAMPSDEMQVTFPVYAACPDCGRVLRIVPPERA